MAMSSIWQDTYAAIALHLVIALAVGGIIGLERSYHGRPAGFRTHALVCLSSCMLMVLTVYQDTWFSSFNLEQTNVDPTRMAQGIMTGIGFLGAGAIIRQGLSVRGLTTAATLWLVAAIGMAAGAGYWEGAIIATVGAVLVLGPLRGAAYRFLVRFRPALDRLLVEIPAGGSPAPIIDAIERQGGRVVSLDVAQEGDRRSVAVDVELQPGSAPKVVAGVAEIDGVLEVRWTD
jgi:putative Mg2+ transporter-C (MgtC) family protein